MTITIVCDILNDAHNGTNITTMNLVNHLKAKGHTVKILCCDRTKQGEENYFICPTKNYGAPVNYLVKKAGIFAANPRRGKEVIAEAIKGSDVVHLMLPFALCKGAYKEAHRQNIPVVSGCHLLPENFNAYIYLDWIRPLNALLYINWYLKTFKHCDFLQYPTQLIRDRYEKFVGKTKGIVISNGIPSSIYKTKAEKPENLKDKIVILSVGRYGRDKNQITLVKAIKYSKYKNDIQLILAGAGWLQRQYKRCGKNLPNQPILKSYNRKDMLELINYSDICVHPATVEAEGISVLEQIGCGKLVIVSDSKYSATKYFAVDKNCIFKAKHAKDLAKKIDYWIEHPEEKKEVEKKYLESAKEYKLDYCMDKMEKMFEKVIADWKKK